MQIVENKLSVIKQSDPWAYRFKCRQLLLEAIIVEIIAPMTKFGPQTDHSNTNSIKCSSTKSVE